MKYKCALLFLLSQKHDHIHKERQRHENHLQNCYIQDQDERIDHMAIYYMQCVTTYSYSVVVVIIFSM